MTAITKAIARADAILVDAALPGYSENLALMKRAVAGLTIEGNYTMDIPRLRASLVAHIKLAEPGYVAPIGANVATREAPRAVNGAWCTQNGVYRDASIRTCTGNSATCECGRR